MPNRLTFLQPLLLLYDAIWCLVTACLLTLGLAGVPGLRGAAWRHGLGRLPRTPRGTPCVWVHAVSVGEMLSIRPLLAELRRRRPPWQLLLTVGNEPAFDAAIRVGISADAVCRLPWDFGPCIGAALDRVRPDVLVLVECELWPNLIARSAARGTRVVMVNARLYERDLPGYRRGRCMFGPLLGLMSSIGAKSESERARFLGLGAPPELVTVGGDTKFDVSPAPSASALPPLRGEGPLWVLASTHDGEEEQILTRAGMLRERFPGLRWLVAPRHLERAAGMAAMAGRFGLTTVLRSRLSGPPVADVVVLDTLGELPAAMAEADLVFVGGSLVGRGGHNPMEPAALGKAIVIGPSVYNFAEAAEAFSRAGAWVAVRDADELIVRAAELLADAGRRADLGRRAGEIIARFAGATDRYAELIERLAEGHGG